MLMLILIRPEASAAEKAISCRDLGWLVYLTSGMRSDESNINQSQYEEYLFKNIAKKMPKFFQDYSFDLIKTQHISSIVINSKGDPNSTVRANIISECQNNLEVKDCKQASANCQKQSALQIMQSYTLDTGQQQRFCKFIPLMLSKEIQRMKVMKKTLLKNQRKRFRELKRSNTFVSQPYTSPDMKKYVQAYDNLSLYVSQGKESCGTTISEENNLSLTQLQAKNIELHRKKLYSRLITPRRYPQLSLRHPTTPIRHQEPMYDAKGLEVHAISVYQGKLTTAQRHNLTYRSKKKPQGKVQIIIHETDKPIMLLLSAHNPVLWDVILKPGAQVKTIVAMGRHTQRVSTTNADDIIVQYLEHHFLKSHGIISMNYKSGGNHDLDIDDFTKKIAGKLPTTFQGSYEPESAFQISKQTKEFLLPEEKRVKADPDYPAVLLSERDHYTWLNKKYTRTEAIQSLRSLFFPQIEEGLLIAPRIERGAHSAWFASPSFSAGKVYFEARLQVEDADSAGTNTSIAMIKAGATQGLGRISIIPRGHSKWYKHNDLFCVAIDFDNSRVYVSVNGHWLTGIPGSGNGFILKKNREYVPAFMASKAGKKGKSWWQVNLGGNDFKHSIPNGYFSYDGTKKR